MPQDELNDAVVLLDSAIKHANRWPPRSSAGWNPEQRQQAADAMERAIGLMRQAAEDLMSTDPRGMWRTLDGDLEDPYLDRAVGLTLEARGIVGRASVQGGHDREALQRASKAIDEAFDLMGGVALLE
jgi:hypothetical protein